MCTMRLIWLICALNITISCHWHKMGPTISFSMLMSWPFSMPTSYTQGWDQKIFCPITWNFSGYNGWNWLMPQLHGKPTCWTKWGLCQWTEQMCSVSLIQETSWEAVILCLPLQLASYIPMGWYSQELLATQRTGNSIMSIGEHLQWHSWLRVLISFAWLQCVHQEKPTVPFITIDHYISLFVTFVAISAIIALWHP